MGRGPKRSALRSLSCRHLLPLLAVTPVQSACTAEWLARFSGGWPNDLDVGLYWFGANDSHEKAKDGDRRSNFYDPTKPTLIFFHGWSGQGDGWATSCTRVTTSCTEELCPGASGLMLMDKWVTAGWNVGFFYWDQFSDESCIRDAEQKIYFDRDGNGIRWKSYDPYQHTVAWRDHIEEDIYSVSDICAREMGRAMKDYKGLEVRFVGHSIGAQLAVRCAAQLHRAEHPAAPARLALLEPYFSKHHLGLFRCLGEDLAKERMSTESGLEDYAAVQTADTVEHLLHHKGVVTEVYKSSALTEVSEFGEVNSALDKYATLVEYQPNWCSSLTMWAELDLAHFKCRHDAIVPVYFMGFAQAPRPISSLRSVPQTVSKRSTVLLCPTPSASCWDEHLASWIRRQQLLSGHQKWTQIAGMETVDPMDDEFKLSPDIEETEVAGAGAANQEIEVETLPRSMRRPGVTGGLIEVIGMHLIPLTLGAGVAVVILMVLLIKQSCETEVDEDAESDSGLNGDDNEECSSLVGAREIDLKRRPSSARKNA